MTIKKADFKFDLRDPMIKILTALFLFITVGTGFSACRFGRGGKTRVELDAVYTFDAAGEVTSPMQSEFTEGITAKLEEKLTVDGRFKVFRTHEAGVNASAEERAKKVNDDKPDLLLSITTGYDPDFTASGTLIYPDVPSSEQNEASLKMAGILQENMKAGDWSADVRYLYYKPFENDQYQIMRTETSDTEKYDFETWTILEKTSVPAVVVEQIHLSNASDSQRWSNEEGYETIAEQYYQAILEYFGMKDTRKDVQE